MLVATADETQVDVGEHMAPIAAAAQGTPVEEVEIREYQGERHGSVDDFRENSIKGVQYVDGPTFGD